MESLKINYSYIALLSLVSFVIFYIVILVINQTSPLFPATAIACGTFFFTSFIKYLSSRLYFSKEGCLFKNIKGEVFFTKWEDMILEIEEKNSKDKSYFISFRPGSFSYLVGQMERKSFFKLSNKYAPANHPIRKILNDYCEEYNYKP